MENAGEILILTGSPGSGKSTAAQAIANHPGSPKVHLHADDFWHFIKNGAIPPYLPDAHEQNAVVMDALATVAVRYAKGGYFVIVDGIIGPWFLAPFRTITVPLHYVVLRPALEEAIQRCQARGGETLNNPEIIADLYSQLSSLGELERHVLPIDGETRDETVGVVTASVQNGAFRLLA